MKPFFLLTIIGVILLSGSCSKNTDNTVEPLPTEPPTGKLSWNQQTPSSSISTGQVFEISGNNFAKNANDNIVKVNGVQVSHVEILANPNIYNGTHTLRTCVPHNALSGEVTLTVGKHTIELGMLPVQQYKATNNWIPLADYPGTPKAYGNPAILPLNSKVYVGLGRTTQLGDSEKNFSDFWEYNPTNNIWTKKKDFPGGNRTNVVSLVIGNKGYVGLGNIDFSNSGISQEKDFWEYDSNSDIWTKKKDFPRGRREMIFHFSVGNRGYVCFINKDSGQEINEFWEYNPSDDSWTQKANFPNKIYSIFNDNRPINNLGTSTKGYVCLNSNEFWEYDPLQNKWSGFPWTGLEGINQKFAFTMNNRVYIGFSHYTNPGFSYPLSYIFIEYDPITNSTKKIQEFAGAPRSGTYAWALNNVGYVGIGFYYKDLWAFRQ